MTTNDFIAKMVKVSGKLSKKHSTAFGYVEEWKTPFCIIMVQHTDNIYNVL